MSTRTVIEINHDYLTGETLESLISLFHELKGCDVTRLLNEAHKAKAPAYWGRTNGIRVLGQRHHSETLTLEVK